MSAPVLTTAETLRAALAQVITCSAQELQDAIGQVVVATAAELSSSARIGPGARSVHDPESRTTALLADRIAAGQEEAVIAQEVARWHGRGALATLVGDHAAHGSVIVDDSDAVLFPVDGFNVRILRNGDLYGLNDGLRYDSKEPSVEFYDAMQNPVKFGPRGQFVSRYLAATLLTHNPSEGLLLDKGSPTWVVSDKAMRRVNDHIREALQMPGLAAAPVGAGDRKSTLAVLQKKQIGVSDLVMATGCANPRIKLAIGTVEGTSGKGWVQLRLLHVLRGWGDDGHGRPDDALVQAIHSGLGMYSDFDVEGIQKITANDVAVLVNESAGALLARLNQQPLSARGVPVNWAGSGRWTFDRGAMPGEPFAFLDGDSESGIAAIVEVQTPGKPATYEVRKIGGSLLSQADFPSDAARAAEERLALERGVSQRTSENLLVLARAVSNVAQGSFSESVLKDAEMVLRGLPATDRVVEGLAVIAKALNGDEYVHHALQDVSVGIAHLAAGNDYDAGLPLKANSATAAAEGGAAKREAEAAPGLPAVAHISTAPRDRVILTDCGLARYVDQRRWGSPVSDGWYACDAGGDIPSCADNGMSISEISPKRWMEFGPIAEHLAGDEPVAESNPFVTSETVHCAQVSYFWTDEKLHQTDYQLSVHDAVDKAVEKATKKHDVVQNTSFTCQWEGVEFEGESLAAVTAAANDVAKVLGRFKGVRPLWDEPENATAPKDDSPSPSM